MSALTGQQGMLIGQLAETVGVTAKTIRFYERAGVLPAPARTVSGYRRYGPEDADRLRFIRRTQDFGLHLNEIQTCRDLEELLAAADDQL